ncbi:hypothetical protein AYI69_g7382 [Smittium culicis]|uniref:Uncharacterized protein n=1 Tax=Smittium culicis TaxID=133412 RepID=A0A1R1XSE8_9FUNG|nr:hypothetical protein AYI69_g7382 [Smittium culicis]
MQTEISKNLEEKYEFETRLAKLETVISKLSENNFNRFEKIEDGLDKLAKYSVESKEVLDECTSAYTSTSEQFKKALAEINSLIEANRQTVDDLVYNRTGFGIPDSNQNTYSLSDDLDKLTNDSRFSFRKRYQRKSKANDGDARNEVNSETSDSSSKDDPNTKTLLNSPDTNFDKKLSSTTNQVQAPLEQNSWQFDGNVRAKVKNIQHEQV